MNTASQDYRYSLEKVTDLEHFEKLRTAWDKLANKQGAYMAFLCFDWFKMWLEHFLKDNKLLILSVYKGDVLVGIAPFLLLRKKFKRMTVKKIELIGNVYSPVGNFIFDDLSIDEKKICLSKIFDYLFYDSTDWDVIDLSPVLEDDRNHNILQKIIQEKGYKKRDEFNAENWYMNGIIYSSDEYFKKLSPKHLKTMVKRRKKLEELGKLEFKLIKSDEDIDRYMDYYYDVYRRSWKKKEGIGPQFHRALARLTVKKGWLRLCFLFLNNFPIATQFCITSNKVGYLLKVAYDEKYKEYGLGNIIHYETIRHMIDDDGIESIDMGAGSEDYKKLWVLKKREMRRILLFNDSFKGNSLALLNNRILPAINRYRVLRDVKGFVTNHFG